ncbi:MAG TPA: hypothetical protein PKC80_00450 [Burkholderiaceae bacterium]|nr:hypothetical protein [Burkholderiaceae bacterium]
MKSNLSRIGYQQAFNLRNKWLARLVTLTVWMFVLLSVFYWGLKFTKLNSISATPAPLVPAKVVETQAVALLLGSVGTNGSKPINTNSNSNLLLLGTANTNSGGGIALIAVEGKPAKPYEVGSQITEVWKLKSLSRSGVTLVSRKSNAEEIFLALQPRQSTTGITVNTNSANSGSNTPRIPLPLRNNAVDPNNSIPGNSNPSASNSGAAASASGLIPSQSVRAVSKYTTQDTIAAPARSVAQVEQLNAPLASNRANSSTSADVMSLK